MSISNVGVRTVD